MPYTYANLKSELQPLLWPQGEAENLILPHNKFFTEALIEIQRWADCYQYNNSQLYRACSRFYVCGLNVMEAPGALVSGSIANTIRRLSVIDRIDPATGLESAAAADQFCSRIYYKQVPHCELLKYQQQVAACSSCGGNANFSGLFGFPSGSCQKGNFPTPDDAEYLADTALPLGHHYQPQVSTDSRWGRSRHGVWSLERGRIYIAPWLQSTETVIIEWDGIKADWDDLDLVVDNSQLKRAVRYYVQWNHLKDYERDDVAAAQAEKDWIMALRGLMRDCREETRVRGCEGSNARQADITIDGEPTPATLQPPGNGGSAGGGGSNPGGAGGGVPGCAAVEAPEFDPPSGSIVTYPTWVTITSATPGAVIYFTTDGTEPTRNSYLYGGPFRLAEGYNLNAVAFMGPCPSPESSSDYISAEDYLNPPGDPTKTGSAPVLTTLCSTTDRAGKWYVFAADGSKDINWKLEFEFNTGSTVKRLEMYETDEDGLWTNGRAWATQYTIHPQEMSGRGFASYPLVLDDGGQINSAYTSNLNEPGEDPHLWTMFGESVGRTSDGSYYKLIIFLEDGTKFYTTHSVECAVEDPEDCPIPDTSGGTFTHTLNLSNQNGTINLAVVVGTFVWLVQDQKWVLGEVTSVAADGGSAQVEIPALVPGTQYSPGDTLHVGPITFGGIVNEGDCLTIPPEPDPTTTTTTTPGETTTTPPAFNCEDCPQTYNWTMYNPDGSALFTGVLNYAGRTGNSCLWAGFIVESPSTEMWACQNDEGECENGFRQCTGYGATSCCGFQEQWNWAVRPGGNCPAGFYGMAQQQTPQPQEYIVIS